MKSATLILATFFSSYSFAQTFTWSLQNSTIAHALTDLYFTSNQNGWVVGSNGTILHTTDGGATWLLQNSGTTEPLQSVFFTDDNTGWAAGGSSSALLLKTSNGGLTWTVAPTNISSGPLIDIAFAPGGQTGFALTTDSVYVSTNGGLNWLKESYTGVTGTAVNKAISVLSASQAFIGGRRFQTGIQDSSPDVYDRRSVGNTFAWGPTTTNQFANMDRLESITFSNSTTGFAGGIQGKVYRMQAALPVLTGPWNICLDLGGGNNQTINSISFIADSIGMLSTPKQIGMTKYTLVYHTANAGDTWTSPDTISDFLIHQLQYVDMATAWAVGVNGKIYKATNALFSIAENQIEADFFVYPNPARNELVISSKSLYLSGTKLLVYNQTGQLVFTTNHTGSDKKAILNIEAIPPGIYLLSVETADGTRFVSRFLKF